MGKFAPGTSGNPKGRPPTQKAVRELLEPFTEQAVLTLVELMQDPAEKPTVRLGAAIAILDRVFGKPGQMPAENDEEMRPPPPPPIYIELRDGETPEEFLANRKGPGRSDNQSSP